MADLTTSTIGAGTAGEIIGEYSDYDGLIARLRQRAGDVGLSYLVIDDLAGLSQGHTSALLGATRKRRLSVVSLIAVAKVLGVKSVMMVDPELVAEMSPRWERRDGSKVHSRRLPKLGATQIRRLLKPIASEMGKRGGRARMAGLSHEQRRTLGRHGAAMRWRRAASLRISPIAEGPLRVWVDDELPPNAPE
jgi:hypothetical protein